MLAKYFCLLSKWAIEDLSWSGYNKQVFDQYEGVCIVPMDQTTTQEGQKIFRDTAPCS